MADTVASMAAGRLGPQGSFVWPEGGPEPPLGYLDAVGGQPLLRPSYEALLTASQHFWSDPARLHHSGRTTDLVLSTARAALAEFLSIPVDGCFVGSSASDLIRAAIVGLFTDRVAQGHPPKIALGATESMAVMAAADAAVASQPRGEIVRIPVDDMGVVYVDACQSAADNDVALMCVQWANAEVGSTQPLSVVHAICRQARVPLFADASQVGGHEVITDNWDALVATPRDWGGPPGIAVLAVKPGIRWRPQEAPDRGWVGGFPDVPAAAAAAAAAEYATPHWQSQARMHRAQIDLIRNGVAEIAGVQVVGHPTNRLPHIVTLVVDDVIGEELVTELDRRSIAAAAGSACTADNRMPSHVLKAMGIDTTASVRVSLPYGCSDESIEGFLHHLPEAILQCRQ